jgi:putative ABC transport system substrate-binding protein
VTTSYPWRRTSTAAVVVAILAGALGSVHAQPSTRTPRIGLLSIGTDPSRPLPAQWLAFFDGLRAFGWVEGQNLLVERRFAAGDSEQLSGFATELAQLGVDVIVATGLRENEALRRATTTIPVVMVVVDDPVEAGFARSLARPGGNFTGLAFSTSGVGGKYIELLKEAVPSLARVTIMASRPQRPAFLKEMEDAARALRVVLSPPALVRAPGELDAAFARAAREGGGGLVFPADAFMVLHRQAIATLAARYRLPAIYAFTEVVEAGGLMAYGPGFPGRFRQAATFVDKILKGAKPADLPVEQPTTLELVVSLRAAKTLGLTIPPSVLVRADRVIE